jgi:hypothetical protein
MLVRGRSGKDRCPGRTPLQAAHGLPSPVPRSNLAQQLRPSHLCNPSQLPLIRLPHLLSAIMLQLQVRRPHGLMYCSDRLDSGHASGSSLDVCLLNTRMVVISARFPRPYRDFSRAFRILRLFQPVSSSSIFYVTSESACYARSKSMRGRVSAV